jgi:hypothetical protein
MARLRIRRQRGSAMVETAVSLPLMFFVVFAFLEFAWVVSKKSEVTNAARVAVRTASLPGSTYADVLAAASDQMTLAGFGEGDWVMELEPLDPLSLEGGGSISVELRADYGAVSLGRFDWLPVPDQITATAAMRKEGDG